MNQRAGFAKPIIMERIPETGMYKPQCEHSIAIEEADMVIRLFLQCECARVERANSVDHATLKAIALRWIEQHSPGNG